jgi:hypothetical protein
MRCGAHRAGSTGLSIPVRIEKAKRPGGAIDVHFKALPQPRLSIRCLCVFWLVLASAACGREDPEQRLLTRFHTMQEAVEEGRMHDFMDGVSEDFSGTGGVDRAALHTMLRARALARSTSG